MRRTRKSIRLAGIALSLMVAATPAAAAAATSPPGEHASGQLIVGFDENATHSKERNAVKSQDATIKDRLDLIDGAVVKVKPGDSLEDVADSLKKDPAIRYAEPNYVRKATTTPSDPLFGSLYGLSQISAPQAWDAVQGSGDVVVAVTDSGIDTTHPDLAPNLWTNPNEIPGNHIDDDSNGFVDDVHGANFVDWQGDPYDDNGHGTHVSGTIGAVGNNGVGVAGVSWNVRIMALKFLDSMGSGLDSDAIAAIDYATEHGAQVINASWGGPDGGQALKEAIQRAGEQGVLFVTAAGNSGDNNDYYATYPASYNEPNIVSVAASNSNDNLAGYSNYGSQTVDLAAPGSNILSTLPGGSYGTASGTSMATPHVSGAAALILAARGGIGAETVRAALLDSVDRTPAYAGATISGGRLNVASALRTVGVNVPDPAAQPETSGGSSQSRPSAFRLKRPKRNAVIHKRRVRFRWQRSRSQQGIKAYRVMVDGRRKRTVRDPDGSGPRRPRTRVTIKLRPGKHRWYVVAIDKSGSKRKSKRILVRSKSRKKRTDRLRRVQSKTFRIKLRRHH